MSEVAHFFLDEGNLIKIRLPFNSKFIKHFRKNTYNTYVWNRQEKVYQTPFSTYAFKFAAKDCTKFFEVSYCDKLKPIIEFTDSIKDCIFEPTLVRSGNFYYIVGSNESLHEQIKDMALDDSMQSLYACSLLGIKVHEDILANNLPKQFAASRTFRISKDMVPLVRDWLRMLEIQNIVMSPRFGSDVKNSLNIQASYVIDQLNKASFSIIIPKNRTQLHTNIRDNLAGKRFVYFSTKLEDQYEVANNINADKVVVLDF